MSNGFARKNMTVISSQTSGSRDLLLVDWTEAAAYAAGRLAHAAQAVLNSEDDGIPRLRRALREYNDEILDLGPDSTKRKKRAKRRKLKKGMKVH